MGMLSGDISGGTTDKQAPAGLRLVIEVIDLEGHPVKRGVLEHGTLICTHDDVIGIDDIVDR